MAVNPFGDSSDSLHAWREKFRQLEVETNSLRLTLTELRNSITELSSENQKLQNINKEVEENLSNTRQELLAFKEIAKDRANELQELSRKLDSNIVDKLMLEKKNLEEKVEELVGQITRGSSNLNVVSSSEESSSEIYNALIPVIVHEFDQNTTKFEESFRRLVEIAAKRGDILTQIVSILYKYGGSGPIERIEELVKNKKQFRTAVDILLEEKIIIQIDDTLQIYNSSSDLSSVSNWDAMTTSELLDLLLETVESGGVESIQIAFDNFRDVMTERGTAASTLLFEIRKLKEGLSGKYVTRMDAKKTINNWRRKLGES